MTLIETKEVLNFRKFMNNEADKYIENLMCRLYDEYIYEGRKPYTEAYKKFFSQLGKTEVKGSGTRFVITIQLNNFQKAEITINPASYKWQFLQSKSKALLLNT